MCGFPLRSPALVHTWFHHAVPQGAFGVPDAELRVGVIAFLALAHAVVSGIALVDFYLLLSTDDVAVAALVQVVPVLRVVQFRARFTQSLSVFGTVLCHKGPWRALLAHDSFSSHGISPWVGGHGAGAKHSQGKQETKHPLREEGTNNP